MNTAEEIYKDIQSLPEDLIKEIWQFIEFLKFKQQITVEKIPNNVTIAAMKAAEQGEYETVTLDDLTKQWSEM
jgi:hypothetical protein